MDYDLIVVGAGSAGYVAAIRAARLGLKTALIEERDVGGTCLNRGCIPTKVLLHSAGLYEEIKKSARFGILAGGASFDFDALKARKEDVVTQLVNGIESLIKANGIDLIRGRARIEGADGVIVGGEALSCKNIIVAAGSKPQKPPVITDAEYELDGVVTSDDLLGMDKPPAKRLAIAGASVIGMEFASIFNTFGSEVTILASRDRILPMVDREIAQNLSMILKKRGVKIITNARLRGVEKMESGGGLRCRYMDGETAVFVECDSVLMATGREANTAGLFAPGLESELQLEKGLIPVDENLMTKVQGIYAIGDCVKGAVQLAHFASAQGLFAAARIAGEEPHIDLSAVPSCIYTDPEIATCGLDSDQAKELGIPVKIGKFIMSANGKSLICDQDRGFIKLVFHAETGVILGAQLMCARATDLISELVTAIVNRLTARQLVSVIRPHPTFTEAVTEAVEDYFGQAVHILPKRKQ